MLSALSVVSGIYRYNIQFDSQIINKEDIENIYIRHGGRVFQIKDVCEAFPEARKVIDDISKVTGKDIPKLLWETEQTELNRSDNSQLAITAATLAVMAALKSKGIEPSAAMGFSLGEFPALYAAGILSFEDVVKVVVQRGTIMQKVCEQIAEENAGNAPGMSAILGLPPEKVEEIANGIEGAYAANLNSVKQTVISGTADGLTKAEEAAKAAGEGLSTARSCSERRTISKSRLNRTHSATRKSRFFQMSRAKKSRKARPQRKARLTTSRTQSAGRTKKKSSPI